MPYVSYPDKLTEYIAKAHIKWGLVATATMEHPMWILDR